MTYHARLNFVMLATIIGLVLFLYLKPIVDKVQEYNIASLSVTDIQDIHLIRQDLHIVLNKSGGHWYLTKPFQARADLSKVEQILQILSTKSNYYFPLVDLERYGLDKPKLQLIINQQIFNFGSLDPINNQQYVATGENIYLISPRYTVMLPSQPSDFISGDLGKQLLSPQYSKPSQYLSD